MTTIYLAMGGTLSTSGLNEDFPWESQPLNVLISFAYPHLIRPRAGFRPARSMLDSGAFTAWQSGKSIDLDALIAETRNPRWHESVCLDVIGDADASMRNALAMKAAGSPAYPVFHIGDPWEHLQEYKKQFPKVGISCRFGEPTTQSIAWVEQCFARAWPYRFHSFGWIDDVVLDRFPFDSADAATWRLAPLKFGKWRFLGKKKGRAFRSRSNGCSVRGVADVRAEVEYYQKLGRILHGRWRSTLAPVRAANPLPSELVAT